jgi:transcriptional regulator with XRE-family HTH domain
MEINLIKYILKKEGITQNELAKQLKVSSSFLSKWKNGKEKIPKKFIKKLGKISRIGTYEEGHRQKWLEITNNSKKIQDNLYIVIASNLPGEIVREASLFTEDWYTGINYDSNWIEIIQRMLITLNDAGVPVKEINEGITFDPAREPIWPEDNSNPKEWFYTPADKVIIPYLYGYLALVDWGTKFIMDINDEKLGTLQWELGLMATKLSLLHVPTEDLKNVNTNMDTLNEYISETKQKSFNLTNELINGIKSNGDSLLIDYSRYYSSDINILKNDVKDDIEDNKDDSKSDLAGSLEFQQETLDRIENLEKLLIEIKEQLNNITNNGEVNGK